uniref:Uncharacterized protein n=1 Tax=Ciona savignyi TaxID=51511 RepID=H2ZA59_CIOSA
MNSKVFFALLVLLQLGHQVVAEESNEVQADDSWVPIANTAIQWLTGRRRRRIRWDESKLSPKNVEDEADMESFMQKIAEM